MEATYKFISSHKRKDEQFENVITWIVLKNRIKAAVWQKTYIYIFFLSIYFNNTITGHKKVIQYIQYILQTGINYYINYF